MLNNLFTKLISGHLIILSLFILNSCGDEEVKIIMVAASLNEVIDQEYMNSKEKDNFFINYGGSLSLARRVENNQKKIGAVIFASNSSIEILTNKQIINEATIKLLAKNSLVLATQKNTISYEDFLETILTNNKQKIVIADQNIAPAGKYSQQVLDQLFSEEIQKKKVVSSGDISYVSNLLISNENYYGIIYKTEAIKNDLNVLYEFPTTLHDDIEYKLGILNNNNNLSINNFIDKLTSDRVLNRLSELGFKIEK